jgi:signal transduction histidine kinase
MSKKGKGLNNAPFSDVPERKQADEVQVRDKRTSLRITDKMILLGIGLGALFWVLDSAIDVLVFHEGTFIQMVLSPEPVELWMRLVVLSLLIMFSVYAQFAISKRKRMEQEIRDKNEQLEAQNEELRVVNEELQVTEEEVRATNEELQSANDELRQAQDRLIRSEKLAAIGQLASGVGHELRNPLGAIKNAVFYVRRKVAKTDLPTAEPRVPEFLDIIDEEVNAANKVISDLLGFSRVAKPAVSPVSLAGLVEDALKSTPLPENVDLTKDIDENLPMVMVDADQIRQVLVNIILNAQQAMTDGGHLTIRGNGRGGFVEVEFADTGSGIPESAINKIFDPLFTTKAKGIGLGLSVSNSILERHGGDIQVESEVDKGTKFTVFLPTQESSQVDTEQKGENNEN